MEGLLDVKKIFVLDTSVIIYDHEAIKHFEEHDVAIPITVLEELDNFKKGNDTKNFCAREFIRFVDDIAKEHLLQDWVQMNGEGSGRFRVLLTEGIEREASAILGENKKDHAILDAALALQKEEKDSRVILVTKDIALRLKAKSLNIPAEDYETGKVRDIQSIYTGSLLVENLPTSLIDRMYDEGSTQICELPIDEFLQNNFYILKNGKRSALGIYHAKEGVVKRIEKRTVYGITPRNAEQTFAIHALLNPDIRLVTLQGVAGTGKTLLALASALEQRRNFRQIFVSRPVVPLSNKDIGYLPGDVNSKINPYMEPLWDNLKYIKNQFPKTDRNYKQIEQMLESEKIEIIPLAYIRGRSLSNVIIIIDEAQNLTPHEVKTIITRAGENTKIIFTGDVRQIDTPYLDAESNGLSYLIDRLKDNELFAHITLQRGERSELANLANELL